ncbi:hypothetical protein OIU77_007323 [Salix suchowensis]|uniref:NAC domain-containing protein n=1 Tax=Salix suchowensis TaxID=1278906 RepID=A0ABQ9AHZ9_9ROSI|nr:hypothetical protein OIU77_007323 [Salix suchowensis]
MGSSSHKDKKYPTGTRTNRATVAGFWKATGRDKAIYAKHDLIGMRKTLVFYKGRAPNGQKSDWIMHEYRLETDENGTPHEEGWVVCRVFKKRLPAMQKVSEHESACWYDEQVAFLHDFDSPNQNFQPELGYQFPYSCKKELDLQCQIPQDHFLQLPLLQSPKFLQSAPYIKLQFHEFFIWPGHKSGKHFAILDTHTRRSHSENTRANLSQEDVIKEASVPENASTSTSSCQTDLWM